MTDPEIMKSRLILACPMNLELSPSAEEPGKASHRFVGWSLASVGRLLG